MVDVTFVSEELEKEERTRKKVHKELQEGKNYVTRKKERRKNERKTY